MTGSHPDPQDVATRPISVAELLARNGTIGSPPVTGHRRRRRGNSNAVTVAELTGEIPIIRDEDIPPQQSGPAPDAANAASASEAGQIVEQAPEEVPEETVADRPAAPPDTVDELKAVGWSEQGPRWPKSPPQSARGTGPEHSNYPRPVRRSAWSTTGNGQPAPESEAEQMSPDPVDSYPATGTDAAGADIGEAVLSSEDSAYLRALLQDSAGVPDGSARDVDEPEPAGLTVGTDLDQDDMPDLVEITSAVIDDDHSAIEADLAGEPTKQPSPRSELLGGALTVLQSILAVVFGAGLFLAFDQLWRWNNIVALVLTVLVTLGLVAAVQAVRKTVDIASTLIAVAVGLLVTLGPLALHAA